MITAFPGRSPTAREHAYLEALATGVRRPSISGKAGYLCRRFGWCEFVYVGSGGQEVPRSSLPARMDAIAIVRAGYRAVGFTLTARGRMALSHSSQSHSSQSQPSARPTPEPPTPRAGPSESLEADPRSGPFGLQPGQSTPGGSSGADLAARRLSDAA